jgi:hypothetical protein
MAIHQNRRNSVIGDGVEEVAETKRQEDTDGNKRENSLAVT